MINEKHLVLTSHRKFLVLISNISGILLHRVLNHNERKKRNEDTKGEERGRRRKTEERRKVGRKFNFQPFYT